MSFRLNPIVLNDDGSLANTQMSFFSSYSVLSDRYKRDLQKGWAGLFRTLIMPYIDENPYRVLYSERPCRSNVPVNVLLGAQILKLMKSIPNDDDLREKACYDLEFRYALCCENYEGAPFSDNVLTRFRRACILHYIDTGEDLIHETFDSLKDQFVKLLTRIERSRTQLSDYKPKSERDIDEIWRYTRCIEKYAEAIEDAIELLL